MPVSTGFRYPTDIGTSGLTPNVVCYVSDDVRSIITHLINNACAAQGSPPQNGWVHDPPWTNAVHAVMYDQEGGAAGGGNIVGEVVYLHVNNPQENETWNADEIAGGLYIGTVPNKGFITKTAVTMVITVTSSAKAGFVVRPCQNVLTPLMPPTTSLSSARSRPASPSPSRSPFTCSRQVTRHSK